MTRLTDGKNVVCIVMNVWDDNGWYTPDWSHDFFDTGSLPYDIEKDAYVVGDIDYCIDQAENWMNSEGDFSEDEPNEYNNVEVWWED